MVFVNFFHVFSVQETVQRVLTFSLTDFRESSSNSVVLAKIMLLVLYKMVFIQNGAALLCVTMRERARVFAATIYCITF